MPNPYKYLTVKQLRELIAGKRDTAQFSFALADSDDDIQFLSFDTSETETNGDTLIYLRDYDANP